MKLQFTLAIRYLSGRKLRSCLTTLALMFGVLVIFSLNIFLPSLLESFQATMLMAANELDLTISHQAGGSFSPDVVEQLRLVDSGSAVVQQGQVIAEAERAEGGCGWICRRDRAAGLDCQRPVHRAIASEQLPGLEAEPVRQPRNVEQ